MSELIWSWEPFVSLSSDARILWLALYTGPTAKRLLPGLWQGAPQQMADEARLPSIEAINALDCLLEGELVEYDPKARVLRITALPDAGDWPTSHTIMRSWWRRFNAIPSCSVRDAHVPTLRWLLEHGASMSEENRSGKPSAKHEEIWSTTFGTVAIPPPRRRGLRHAAVDNSTATQPSLFSLLASSAPKNVVSNPSNHIGWHPSAPVEVEVEVEVEVSGSGRSNAGAKATEEEQIPLPRPQPLPSHDRLPLSTADLLLAVSAESDGRFPAGPTDDRIADALSATVRACHQAGVGLDDLRLVGRWIGAGGIGYRTDLGPVWASKPGNLIDAVASARAWLDRGAPRLGEGARRAAAPAPASAFTSGRKQL